jgi:hypothetical protein
MFKTIFIIFVSMIVSTLTTAGLLFRYTSPPAPQPVTFATASPLEIINSLDVEPVAVVTPVVNSEIAVSLPPEAEIVPEAVNVEIATDQLQRSFNHQLLASDINNLSHKLQRFNDFLSAEVQRLKDGKDGKEKKQP